MDTTPITGLAELDAHLDDLVDSPELALDAKLFDEVELQLTEANIPPLIPRLLPKLTTILKGYTQDPAIIVSLAIKLLGPVSFTQILSLASQDSLIQALRSPAPSANILAMTILHKAAHSPADVAIFSIMPALLSEFLVRYLAAPQVEVGEKGGKVLGDLLDVDCELPPPAPVANGDSGQHNQAIVLRRVPGQGKLWRRVLQDQEIYALVLSLINGSHPSIDARQLSLSQGRMLRLLPRLAALNFAAVSRANFPNLQPGGGGILQFVALQMLDKEDVLMNLSLVDFFETLISVMRVAEYSPGAVEILRSVLRDAMANGEDLRRAILTLPDRTVPEEAETLRKWLRELIPGAPVRVSGWEQR